MELNCKARLDSPLILPPCFACTILPVTAAPAGIAVRPWMATAWASAPWNACPAPLLLAPIASVVRTVMTVPAGTTTGGGGGLGVGCSATWGAAGAAPCGGAVAGGWAPSAAAGAGVGLGGVFSAFG